MIKRLTISLDEELAKALQKIARESGLKVSTLVGKAIKEYLTVHNLGPIEKELVIHPKVLWQVRGHVRPRGPSIRAGKLKVGSFKVVDISELQIS